MGTVWTQQRDRPSLKLIRFAVPMSSPPGSPGTSPRVSARQPNTSRGDRSEVSSSSPLDTGPLPSTSVSARKSGVSQAGGLGGETTLLPKDRTPSDWRTTCAYIGKKIRRMSPRQKLCIMFLLGEAIIAVGLIVQLTTLRISITELMKDTAARQVPLVENLYTKKLQELQYVTQSDSQLSTVISFLKGTGSRSVVQNLLYDEASSYKLEYYTLLDTNNTILLNAGSQNRTGHKWNPHGIVSRVTQHPKRGQITLSHIVPWSELEKEGAGIYRERVSILEDADYTHPYDTHADSLIRYIVTPVWSNGNNTGKVLGVLVAGDIMNGKETIVSLATKAFSSGYAGLFTWDSIKKRFIRASSYYAQTDEITKHQSYTSTFDRVEANPSLQKVLHQATKKRGSIFTIVEGPLAYAMRSVTPSTWNSTTIKDTPTAMGVVVRGVAVVKSDIFTRVFTWTLTFKSVLFVINLIILYASWVAFIKPLERAAQHLRANKKVDLTEIASLRMYARFTMTIVATVVLSVTVAIVSSVIVDAGMKESVLQSAKSEQGVATACIDWQNDLVYTGYRSEAVHNPYIKALIKDPLDYTSRNATRKLFRFAQSQRQIQFSFITGSNMKNIMSANKWRVGEVINYENVTARTLASNDVYKIAMIMPYDDFLRDSPPIFMKHRVPQVPDSKLSPYNTKDPVFVRFVSLPVYLDTNTKQTKPDGVLIKGDVVNARTFPMERVVQGVSTAYAGAFIFDRDNNKFIMVVSVMRESVTSPWRSDVDVPHEVLWKCLKSGGKPTAVWGKIEDKEWALAAHPIPPDRIHDQFGDVAVANNFEIFTVYGKPLSVTKVLQKQQSLYTALCLVLQLIATAIVCATSYQPLNAMLNALEKKGFLKPADRPTLVKVIRVYVIERCRKGGKKAPKIGQAPLEPPMAPVRPVLT